MKDRFQQMACFAKDESGQDLIEYALVAALIALGAVTAMSSVASSLVNAFNGIGTKITGSIPPSG